MITFLRWARFRWAYLKWFLRDAYRLGDPLLGQGDVRAMNRRILRERYKAEEPKRADFGLRARE